MGYGPDTLRAGEGEDGAGGYRYYFYYYYGGSVLSIIFSFYIKSI
jgi:hypothetical protein